MITALKAIVRMVRRLVSQRHNEGAVQHEKLKLLALVREGHKMMGIPEPTMQDLENHLKQHPEWLRNPYGRKE